MGLIGVYLFQENACFIQKTRYNKKPSPIEIKVPNGYTLESLPFPEVADFLLESSINT